MARNGRVAVDRRILNWRWYKNANTFRVFMHLLLTANYAPGDYENIRLERGDAVITYSGLGEQLDLTVREVRTALEHLKLTGEVTGKKYAKYQVISVVNYDSYQGSLTVKTAVNRQANGSQSAGNRQLSNKKNNNNINNNNIYPPYNPPLKGDGNDTSALLPFGEYGNVLMTDAEHKKLADMFPALYMDAINELDLTMEESERNKKRYADKKHYIVIRRRLSMVLRRCRVTRTTDGCPSIWRMFTRDHDAELQGLN